MANKHLFQSTSKINEVKETTAVNEAGSKAYALSNEQALAQLVLTGTFNNKFYSTDEEQLKSVLDLCNKVSIEYVAKLAVYARVHGKMKDTPALLAAFVSSKNNSLLKKIFPSVINDPKMLRNFVQIIRSGVVGRRSFGSGPKKLIQKYLNSLTDEQLFKANVGQSPNLNDIIKLVHPRATNPARNALYQYILGKSYEAKDMLPVVNSFETFKKDMTTDLPNVPFQMLTALPLTTNHWKTIAERATWNQIRQNLNSFVRHGVLDDKRVESILADKLKNPEEVRRSKTMPYQLFSTYINTENNVSNKLKVALQEAAEIAMENVPAIDGKIKILLDVSGSMRDPITGHRKGATSKMRCIDVASMISASILRKNIDAEIIAFDTTVKRVNLNPKDSVMTNSQKLIAVGANGGTDCAAPLADLNQRNETADVVIMVSDNQSLLQSEDKYSSRRGTPMMHEWAEFKKRNKHAKLVAIDIAPYANAQVHDRADILNLAGFSDQVFDIIAEFVKGSNNNLVVDTINKMEI